MQNPMRKGSMGHKVVAVLLRSHVPLTVRAVAKRAKISEINAAQVLAALRNPMHNSVLRRSGLMVARDGRGFYFIKKAKPEPNARRRASRQVKGKQSLRSTD